MAGAVIYAFGDCELDAARHVLVRGGEEQSVEPQIYDVLVHLIENRGRLVTKEELLDQVWGDRFVSESALTSRIKSARRVVGDDGRRQGVIRTVHGRGYEFVAGVTTHDVVPRPGPGPGAPTGVERAVASALPTPVHELIGRDELLPTLVEELARSRLLTLVGPAGVGKTSVAFALARAVGDRYADGVWPVDLATVTEPAAAIQALATALDMKSQPDRRLDDTIVDLLRPRNGLLLLDNCEHVVEPISDIVEEILRRAPSVWVIATSREPLATPSEQLWPVDPLPVILDEDVHPAQVTDNPSVRLFVERAQAADPHFELDAATAPAVAEICRRLDGIPLAIELAAARLRSLQVTDVAEGLDERFRLLKAVRRGTEVRHQTLQNAVRWSFDLLAEDEQDVFTSLSVFAGSFDLDAAVAVVGSGDDIDMLDVLSRLIDRSMLVLGRSDRGVSRYEMLETMREFGRSRMGDDAKFDLHGRHLTYLDTLTDRIEASRRHPDEGRWTAFADQSFPDLRAAHRFALGVGDVDSVFSMIDRLSEYGMRALRYEVLDWAGTALTLEGAAEHPLHPRLLALQGYGAWVGGDYETAASLAEMAIAEQRRRDLPPSPTPHRVLGNVAYQLGDPEQGLTHTALQLEMVRESGDPSEIVHAAYMHSVASSSMGEIDEAVKWLEMAEAASRETMNPTDLASAALARGFTIQNDEAAVAAYGEAVDWADQAGNRWMSSFAATEMSGRLLRSGEERQACAALGLVVDVWHRSGDWAQQWLTLTHSVIGLSALGADELATQVIGSIDRHATFAATPLSAPLRERALQAADELRARLGEDRYQSLLADGASLPVVDVVHRVRTTLVSGRLDN